MTDTFGFLGPLAAVVMFEHERAKRQHIERQLEALLQRFDVVLGEKK